MKLYKKFKEQIDKNTQYIEHVRNYNELMAAEKSGKIGAFLTIEEWGASRNLTDDMVKKLSEDGGVAGINFCLSFMGQGDITTLNHMVKHIEHMTKVGGVDVISLGSILMELAIK